MLGSNGIGRKKNLNFFISPFVHFQIYVLLSNVLRNYVYVHDIQNITVALCIYIHFKND